MQGAALNKNSSAKDYFQYNFIKKAALFKDYFMKIISALKSDVTCR